MTAHYIYENKLSETYKPDERPKITTPDELFQIIEPKILTSPQERFYTVSLDSQLHAISFDLNYIGRSSEIQLELKDLLRTALKNGADCIMVFHNHPGGATDPSQQDIDTTKNLIKACRLIDLPLVDHLVVSINGYQSIRRNNPYLWTDELLP